MKRCWHFGCPLATASTKFKLNYIGLKDKWKWNSSFCLFFVIFKWTLFGLKCKVDHKHLTDKTNINLVCKIADVKIPSASRHISTMMVILWLILIDMRIQCVTMLPPSVTIFFLFERGETNQKTFYLQDIALNALHIAPAHTQGQYQTKTTRTSWDGQSWWLIYSELPSAQVAFIHFHLLSAVLIMVL